MFDIETLRKINGEERPELESETRTKQYKRIFFIAFVTAGLIVGTILLSVGLVNTIRLLAH